MAEAKAEMKKVRFSLNLNLYLSLLVSPVPPVSRAILRMAALTALKLPLYPVLVSTL